MKWLVIIVIVIAVVALVWLRTMRQTPPIVDSHGPHRLDDSVTPPSTTAGPAPEVPAPAGGTLFDPQLPLDQPAPGSDLASEPSIQPDNRPDPDTDPLPPQGRPEV